MLLSIIVPIYNVENYLERCILSLLNQNINKNIYEIILINDGSTDHSLDICKKFNHEESNIIVISQDNQGQGAARNLGINYAKGEFILFIDSDDYIEANTLLEIVNFAKEKELDICEFQSYIQKKNLQRIKSQKNIKEGLLYTGEELLLEGFQPGAVWDKVFKKTFLTNNGIFFQTNIVHEDIEFLFRAYPLAKRIMYVDNICYNYCYNNQSTDRSKEPKKILKGIESNIYIASKLLLLSKQNYHNARFSEFLIDKSNSITITILLNLLRNKNINYNDKKKCLFNCCKLGLYPISSKGKSIPKKIMIKMINVRPILLLFLKL